jgi:hypothetical protein
MAHLTVLVSRALLVKTVAYRGNICVCVCVEVLLDFVVSYKTIRLNDGMEITRRCQLCPIQAFILHLHGGTEENDE